MARVLHNAMFRQLTTVKRWGVAVLRQVPVQRLALTVAGPGRTLVLLLPIVLRPLTVQGVRNAVSQQLTTAKQLGAVVLRQAPVQRPVVTDLGSGPTAVFRLAAVLLPPTGRGARSAAFRLPATVKQWEGPVLKQALVLRLVIAGPGPGPTVVFLLRIVLRPPTVRAVRSAVSLQPTTVKR